MRILEAIRQRLKMKHERFRQNFLIFVFLYRINIMKKLNDLAKEWIFEVSIRQDDPREVAESLGGKVFDFGSYGLKVHAKGSFFIF